jgi:hypothetical protein
MQEMTNEKSIKNGAPHTGEAVTSNSSIPAGENTTKSVEKEIFKRKEFVARPSLIEFVFSLLIFLLIITFISQNNLVGKWLANPVRWVVSS